MFMTYCLPTGKMAPYSKAALQGAEFTISLLSKLHLKFHSYLFSSVFLFLRKKSRLMSSLRYLCLPFRFLNQLVTYFHEISYERYSIAGRLGPVRLKFLQSMITTWRTHELPWWKRQQLHFVQDPEMIYDYTPSKILQLLWRSFFFPLLLCNMWNNMSAALKSVSSFRFVRDNKWNHMKYGKKIRRKHTYKFYVEFFLNVRSHTHGGGKDLWGLCPTNLT